MKIARPANDNTFDFLRAGSAPAHQLASEDCYSVHSRDGVGNPAAPETSGGVDPLSSASSLGGFDRTKMRRSAQYQTASEMLFGILVMALAFMIAGVGAILLGTIATKFIGQLAHDAVQFGTGF